MEWTRRIAPFFWDQHPPYIRSPTASFSDGSLRISSGRAHLVFQPIPIKFKKKFTNYIQKKKKKKNENKKNKKMEKNLKFKLKLLSLWI